MSVAQINSIFTIKLIDGDIKAGLFGQLQRTLNKLVGPGQVDLMRLRKHCIELLCRAPVKIFMRLLQVIPHLPCTTSLVKSDRNSRIVSWQHFRNNNTLDGIPLLPDGKPCLVSLHVKVSGPCELISRLRGAAEETGGAAEDVDMIDGDSTDESSSDANSIMDNGGSSACDLASISHQVLMHVHNSDDLPTATTTSDVGAPSSSLPVSSSAYSRNASVYSSKASAHELKDGSTEVVKTEAPYETDALSWLEEGVAHPYISHMQHVNVYMLCMCMCIYNLCVRIDYVQEWIWK